MKANLLRRRRIIGVTGLAIALVCALGAGSVSSAEPAAHAAKRKSLHLTGTATLHLVRKSGSTIYESGTATGTLPGTVSARFVTQVSKVTGTVTFHPNSGGSLTLTAVGYPSSLRTVTPFTGSVAVSSGAGKYKNAVGSGSFSGTANRRTWAVTVHADAHLTY